VKVKHGVYRGIRYGDGIPHRYILCRFIVRVGIYRATFLRAKAATAFSAS